ncbi:MAG TPA: class I SAM-dependent methyltransferase [Pyrinomonadaceae bacterium]|nr:class I SAM-dependent methyltransferase [Pyrinomonadaceae bacterium]
MKNTEDVLDSTNKRTYADAKVVAWYDELDFIHKPEATIFERLRPLISAGKTLDIGIGGGRTTRYLLEISNDYTGIDYTQGCVDAAKTKFPHAKIAWGDARDLGAFETGAFDFVLFSFNSIDYVSHEDRLQVLREIHRVLRRGGYFAFSTHNRDWRQFRKFPWQQGEQVSLNLLKSSLYTLAFLPKHLSMRKHEIHTDDYSIINDNAHGFSLLAYYIPIEKQKQQLESMGFEEIEAFDMEGNVIERDVEFPWTYYLARKPERKI